MQAQQGLQALYLCRAVQAYTIGRAVQDLHYMQGFAGPAGLYRPCLHAGLYRLSTICRPVKTLHYTQGFVGPAIYAGL